MHYNILLSSSHFTGEERKYVDRAFEDNLVASAGPNIDAFEAEICKLAKTGACSAVSSGTAAIHLALIILGIKEGDEVLCSTFTFSATVNPILYQKAIPIFVDSEEETWNMCPKLLEEAIVDRIKLGKKPKAILLVHLYGMPSKMDLLLEISTKYNIPIIEDAAEAIGSLYKEKALGSFGDIGIFSFNGNKVITSSGGGAIVSNNIEYCKEATFLATQARDQAPHYQHSKIGYNYRMSNISAGIGLGQLEVLEKRISARRKNFEYYKKHLQSFSKISFLTEPHDCYSNRWLTTVITDNLETRENIRLSLERKKIESRPLWKPMHLQPIFQNYPLYQKTISENLFERGLCLPSGSNLSTLELDSVIETIAANFQ